MGDRFRNALAVAGRIAKRNDGFAVPTALLMMLAAFATVSVGVVTTVQVQGGTVRDQGTKSALELAESGANEALLHFNRIAPTENPCSPVSTSGPTGGWCPVVSRTDPAGGTYTYQAQAPYSTADDKVLNIVATGTVGTATRRILLTANSVENEHPFAVYSVKAADWIHMDSNAEVHAGAATNGDIVLSSNAKQCGQASVGIGKEMQLISNAQYYHNHNCTQPYDVVNQEQIILPPVNQGDVATNNDNGRFFTQDPISGSTTQVCWNGKKGNGSNGSCGARHLDLSANTSVTLGGSKYSFCKLTMSSNTAIYIAAGRTVAIYFDSPEACGYPSGTVQLDMDSNSRITSTTGGQTNAQLLFVGSIGQGDDFRQTQVHMSSNTNIGAACEQNFVLYAPLTDITLNSNSTYCGGLAGKTLHLDSNARIYTNPAVSEFPIPATASHYTTSRFVECNTTPGNPPSAGC
jgi:hypothetical protein